MNASTSRSNTSTPIKAITSTLSARAAPAIPPAVQVYDHLPKAALRKKLLNNVFLRSGIFVWLMVSVWSIWFRGGFRSLGLLEGIVTYFRPDTLGLTLLWWTAGSLPITVMRQRYLGVTPSTSLSPSLTIRSSFSRKSTYYALYFLMTSAVFLTALHTFSGYVLEIDARGDPRLRVWAKSKKHPYHINGRFLYLFSTQIFVSITFWARDILIDRYTVVWTKSTKPLLISMLLPTIPTVLLSIMSSAIATISFAVSRMFILPVIYRLPLVHSLLRPFFAHYLRPTFTLSLLFTHLDLVVRAGFLNLCTMLVWDVTSNLFELVASVPVTVAIGTKDAGLALTTGIHSTDPYLRYHAMYELAELASSSSDTAKKGRGSIYSDMKYNPSLWASVVKQCLQILSEDHQLLVRKGLPPPPAPAPIPPKPAAAPPQTPVIRKPIFKPSTSSPLSAFADTISSDGVVTKAFTHTADDVIGVSDAMKAVKDVLPSLPSPKVLLTSPFKTPARDQIASSAASTETEASNLSKSVSTTVEVATNVWSGKLWKESAFAAWWTRERKSKYVIRCVPNKQLDACVVEVLSNFIAHSLDEDTLGVVQRDIPRILDVFVSYLSALEELDAELTASLPPNPDSQDGISKEQIQQYVILEGEVRRGKEWVGELVDSLRSGLGLIARTFGEKLAAFRFPERTASRLQAFVDYGL